jgi:hypothetical protein
VEVLEIQPGHDVPPHTGGMRQRRDGRRQWRRPAIAM